MIIKQLPGHSDSSYTEIKAYFLIHRFHKGYKINFGCNMSAKIIHAHTVGLFQIQWLLNL